MCLSTVYRLAGNEKELLCKNISTVSVRDGKYIFTDIMGISRSFPGEIEKIDLMDNFIYIRDNKS